MRGTLYIRQGFYKKGRNMETAAMAEPRYLSLGQVATLLGLTYGQLYWAHRTGRLANPPVAGRARVYGPEDIQRVAAHFGKTALLRERPAR